MNDLLTNVEATKKVFRRAFGYTPPHVVQVPGRIELLGNHTDYCKGLVLAATISKYLILTGAPRTDGTISVLSERFGDQHTFSRSNLGPQPSAHWINYLKGLLSELLNAQAPFPGFDLAIGGNLPSGAGLASSAALLVGLALFLHRLAPFRLAGRHPAATAGRPASPPGPFSAAEKLDLAQLCHRAEVHFVGLHCGILDQLACLFGQESHGLEIDCQSLSVSPCPLYGQVCWVLCDSGVRHQLTDGAYNQLRAYCDEATHALKLPNLRRLELTTLRANQAQLTPRQFQCAYHILGENQRVIFAARALREGDLEQFGQYLLQSHQSSRELLQNSCPELDLLVDLARTHPACLGARLSGGGFGGMTIHLVQAEQVDPYCSYLERQFTERIGYSPQPEVCRIVNGAGLL